MTQTHFHDNFTFKLNRTSQGCRTHTLSFELFEVKKNTIKALMPQNWNCKKDSSLKTRNTNFENKMHKILIKKSQSPLNPKINIPHTYTVNTLNK